MSERVALDRLIRIADDTVPLVHHCGLAGAESDRVENGDRKAAPEVDPLPLPDAHEVEAQDEGGKSSFGGDCVVLEEHWQEIAEVLLPYDVPHVWERYEEVLRKVGRFDRDVLLSELWGGKWGEGK